MGRPRKKITNVTRVLEALSKKSQTTQELAENLQLPLGTAFVGGGLMALIFVVPAHFYYEVISYIDGGSTIDLNHWIELD